MRIEPVGFALHPAKSFPAGSFRGAPLPLAFTNGTQPGEVARQQGKLPHRAIGNAFSCLAGEKPHSGEDERYKEQNRDDFPAELHQGTIARISPHRLGEQTA